MKVKVNVKRMRFTLLCVAAFVLALVTAYNCGRAKGAENSRVYVVSSEGYEWVQSDNRRIKELEKSEDICYFILGEEAQ